MSKRVDIQTVLAQFLPAYQAHHRVDARRSQVLTHLAQCRTAALGGFALHCEGCDERRILYHACRDRHCPKCQQRASRRWSARQSESLLPVPYFHLVFTLPHDLNGLIGQRPRALYEMLFGAVSGTLTEFAANPRWLGGTAAFTLVLHTWKQDLGRHVHLHALVPGGALTADGQWVAAKRGFLFPITALSEVFRGKFVSALKLAREEGKLRAEALRGDGSWTQAAWNTLLTRLYTHDWVVYAKQALGGPEQVLDYLGRYTHRVAVSNERILGMDAHTVRLRVRDSANGNRKRTLHVPAQSFIERFFLHVLPKGFKRIRHYGLLGPAGKALKLAQARVALAAPTPDPALIESVEQFMGRINRIESLRCTHCAIGRLIPTAPIAPVRVPPVRGPP